MFRISKDISFEDIKKIVQGREEIVIDSAIANKIQENFAFLDKFRKDKIIYGITTGFGPMAQYRIDDDSLIQLQYNIIRSHCTGAGKPLDDIYVRAAMLARMTTFLQGLSGVNMELIDLLVNFLNLEIYPIIPEHGSVGASGDLVQMAHIALTLIGEGEVRHKGEVRDTASVMKEYGLKPISIYIREGLALANGTGMMTGIGFINIVNAKKLLRWSILASVMMNEITHAYDDFVSESLNNSKPHPGQLAIADLMRGIMSSSGRFKKRECELYNNNHNESVFVHKVQSYYSLRCVPQILGPVYDTIENAEKVVITEFNSACDNPIVDNKSNNIYHGGNFHGDYVSFEMDKLKIAVTKLTMLAERQLNYLFHDKINGILPPFVNLGVLGLNYGLQAAQFTATSTTAECQTLSNPMYIHSIPNNNDNQDIVSMGTNSALLAKTVIENSFQVLAIQYMALMQAIDYLKIENDLSEESLKVYRNIRSFFPVFADDTPLHKDIENTINYLKEN
ncbi:MAG: histidine ammonia-lyase [Bacteroidetes bacterium GWF2_40_14]|nr:MAG: histidine ammonia-lyase [Bacteroidetes bacterium GWF2_40_14]